ncbi:hypothetical protein LIPSTDRAFT_70375 [Lipomyces starkeyi NRRL Y-11557]|uniref:Uncharacterized protein n=1 Tax=Lipomyces starkeyi NRRL Y-11557 TaxID=675824 RepID=A0A1E3Q6X8_LIPST|nr:hypothetical protein LIPSTDRAFT_70375 [Lipomyces starkeyi NRRL Y-11557]
MWSVHSFGVPSHMEIITFRVIRNVKDLASGSNIWLSRCSRNDDTTSMKSS